MRRTNIGHVFFVTAVLGLVACNAQKSAEPPAPLEVAVVTLATEPVTMTAELPRKERHVRGSLLSQNVNQRIVESIGEVVLVLHADDRADSASGSEALGGGFTPLQPSTLSNVAQQLHATPAQIAIAWLLRRAPNMLLIAGTSSVAHLRENVAAATLRLPDDAFAALNELVRRRARSSALIPRRVVDSLP